MRGDASNWFKSLDDVYYFGGQNGHNMEAVEPHSAQNDNEIDLQPGDLVISNGGFRKIAIIRGFP